MILADGSLVKLGCIYDNGDGLKFCDDPDKAPKEANIVVGAIVKIPPIESDPTKQISRCNQTYIDIINREKFQLINIKDEKGGFMV